LQIGIDQRGNLPSDLIRDAFTFIERTYVQKLTRRILHTRT